MTDLVIQRVVFPLDPGVAPLYYRAGENPFPGRYPDPIATGRRSLVVGRGARIDTNTYFNSLYEAYWRRHTRLERLVLRLRLSGVGTVRLWRACRGRSAAEVGRVDFDGQDLTIDMDAPETRGHGGQLGTLFFEVIARSNSVTISSADWVAADVAVQPVKIVAGYCTFNRETFIVNNVKALVAERDLADCLSQVVVVDQGTRKVKDHAEYRALPAETVAKVCYVDQANFGGTGGFTRCILEAMQVHGATHVLLLDDDAIVEPESVFRTAALFALAKEQTAVGGPMLDLLRPTEMYEAGGSVLPDIMGVGGHGQGWSLLDPQNVHSLAELHYPQYNAWWFFAFPLSMVGRLGLPLPLFIRCDDLEFGCRLMQAGVPPLTLPGLGVWHLPFYVKKHGWEHYYYHRNMLIALALRFPVSRISLASTFFRVLLHRLLTLDYFKAWAACEAMADYLAGPRLLHDDPRPIHNRVLEFHRNLSPASLPKSECLPAVDAAAVPESRIRQAIGLLSALMAQLIRPSPARAARPSYALDGDGENWYALRHADVVAIDDRNIDTYIVRRRDRGKFLGLFARGLWSTLRLLCTHGRTVRTWQAGTEQLTEIGFWRKYLGMTAAETHVSPVADRIAKAA
jgi:galactofuranosylgalactofuranosylrhamnosyl-N-acetylglucosaminyl-diphospho-decaprenol beta-1,5/1,6-galactofuranosyltransferase